MGSSSPAIVLGGIRHTTANALLRAAVALGRLDGVARLSPPSLQRLLSLRCAVIPNGGGPDGMMALLRADREGEPELVAFADALCEPMATTAEQESITAAAEGLLPALLAAREAMRDGAGVPDASLAFSRQLWRDGTLGGPWLALPFADAGAPDAYGDPQTWLDAVSAAVARESEAAARGLERARERLNGDETKIRALGRAAHSALDLFRLLAERLIVSIGDVAPGLGQTVPTTGSAMARLERLGVAREVTGRARDRRFAYRALVNGMGP